MVKFQGSKVPGLKVSKVTGFHISSFQGCPGFRGVKVPGFQGVKVLRFQGCPGLSRVLGSSVPGFQGSRVTSFQGSNRDPGFQGSRAPRFKGCPGLSRFVQGSGLERSRVPGFQGLNRDPGFQGSMVQGSGLQGSSVGLVLLQSARPGKLPMQSFDMPRKEASTKKRKIRPPVPEWTSASNTGSNKARRFSAIPASVQLLCTWVNNVTVASAASDIQGLRNCLCAARGYAVTQNALEASAAGTVLKQTELWAKLDDTWEDERQLAITRWAADSIGQVEKHSKEHDEKQQSVTSVRLGLSFVLRRHSGNQFNH